MKADSSSSPNPQASAILLHTGTVIAVQANYYWVKLAHPPADHPFLLCTRRSRLKKIGQRIMVGDQVQVEEPDWIGERGAISEVFQRATELDRPPVANADQILLVFALAEPTLEPMQISRFLVKAESTGLTICLCLSKSDLVSPEVQAQWIERLQGWGYQPLLLSLHQPQGLAALDSALSDKITVVSGPSGVGKSSLINRLIPKIDIRTSAVSGKLGRGRHTTRHVELFDLPLGGLLADTPGFNQPDLSCTPSDLIDCFPEARQRLAKAACQFSNCQHRDEPNCAVRGNWERYEHYLRFWEEVTVQQQAVDRSGDAEATTKVMSKGDGQSKAEPMLAAKRYRRPSRRTEKQGLKSFYQDMDEREDKS